MKIWFLDKRCQWTIKNATKNKKVGSGSILLGALDFNLLRKLLAGKRVQAEILGGWVIRAQEETIRVGKNS